MKTIPRRWAASVSMMLAAASASSARADVRYAMDVHIDNLNTPVTPHITMTTCVKGNSKRVETSISAGPVHKHLIALALYDRQQLVRIDTDSKTYAVTPLDPGADDLSALLEAVAKRRGGQDGGDARAESGDSKADVTVTYGVEKEGDEKVESYRTQHYKETVHTRTSGFLGNADRTTRIEWWVTDTPTGLQPPDRSGADRTVTDAQGRQIVYHIHGDAAEASRIQSLVPARVAIQGGEGGKSGRMELTGLSTSPLDDSLFQVPDGYTEVSPEQFRQSQKQQKRRRGRFGGLFGGRR